MQNMDVRAAVLAAIAAGISSAPAFAQQAEGLEEVVVTAERRESNVQDTPIAVSAFDESTLEARGVIRTLDLQNSVPGLFLYTGAANQSMLNVYMRGAGEQTGAMVTSESAVSFYVDDFYRGRLSGANTEFLDMERIEVLRGPQGTLYGRNSMTGAIKMYTKTPRPGDEFAGQVAAEYGEHDTIRLKGTVSGSLGETLAGSISAFYAENGPYYYNRARREDRGDREMYGVRGKLSWESDSTQVVASAYYTSNEEDGRGWVTSNAEAITGVPGVFSLTGGFRQTQTPIDEFGENTQSGATLTITHDFGGFMLKSLTGYFDQSDDWRTDLSGGLEVAPNVFIAGVNRLSVSDHTQISQEFQLQGTAFDNRLNWITGAYFLHEEGEQFVDDVLFVTIPVLQQVIDVETDSWAVFAQGTYSFTDRLSGTLGIRYTQDDKSLKGLIADFPGSTTRTAVDRSDKFSATSPKLALEYKASDDVMFYGSVGKGFKAGGYNSLLVADPVGFNTPFEAETLIAYEVGAKTEWLDNRLRVNVSAFWNDFSDIQQGASVQGSPSFPIQNSGDAEVKGLEIELTGKISPALTAFAFVALTDDEYTRLAPNSIAAVSNAKGLLHISDVQAQAGFTYDTVWQASGNALRFGADYAYRSAYYSDASTSPVTRTEPFGVLNAFVSLSSPDGKWNTRLYGKNLTEEEYYTIGLALVSGIRVPSEPRTWGLEVKYNF